MKKAILFFTGVFMSFLMGVTSQSVQAASPQNPDATTQKSILDPEPLSERQEQVTRLSNGLSVLILKDSRFPLVSTRLYVHAGSAYENPKQAGISHVLEHMVFKGTADRPKGSISQEVESAGGYLNAATSYDYTVYITDMPARHWKLGMDVARDMAFHATLDPAELESEKDVIVAELKRGEDDPGNRLFKTLLADTLKGTPYENSIIGTEETIRAITVDAMRAYIKRLYQPQNMLLVVVGDINPEEVLDEAEKAFGRYVNDAPIPQPIAFNAEQLPVGRIPDKPIVVIQPGPWNKVYLAAALPVPGNMSYQTETLDVLAQLLGGDRTSLFYRTYKYERQLVDSISVANYGFERVGVFFISAELDADKVETFWTSLTTDLAKLKASQFTKEELNRAVLNLEDDLYRSKETLSGLASKVGYFQFFLGGGQGERNSIEALRSVDAPMLQQALDTWIRPERLTTTVLPPKDAQIVDMAAILAANWKEEPKTTVKTDASVAGTEVVDLGNGRKVVLIADTTLPYISANLAFSGGEALLSPTEQGLATLAANVITKGTNNINGNQGRSATDIQTFLADRAAGLTASAGRKSFTLSFTTPARSNADLFGLLGEIVTSPAFSSDETSRGIKDQLAAIKSRDDQPLGRAFRQLPPFLFPDSVYGYLQLGEPDVITTFSSPTLRDFWNRQNTRPWVLSVAGTFDREQILAFANSLPVPSKPKVDIPTPFWGKEKTLDIPMPDRKQAHLMLIFKTASEKSPDAPALDLLEDVLGGMGGVLFRDLRDKQGLGYTVTAFNRQDDATGYMAFYIGTEPDKMEQAEQGFRKILADIHTSLLPTEDLTRGKNQLEGEYYRSIQSLGSRASQAAILILDDRPLSFVTDQIKRSQDVSPEQLKQIIDKYFIPGSEYVIKVLP